MAIVKQLFISLLVLASATATPTPKHHSVKHGVGRLLSDLFDTESVDGGRFLLENNLWGSGSAASGWQKSQVISTSGDSVSWQTSYNWAGGNTHSVKSYANLDLRVGLGKPLESILSMPTSWTWSYSSDTKPDLVADVSYDIWLSDVPGSSGASPQSTFEIMIWLSSRGGAIPTGYQMQTIEIDGVSWALYQGPVSTWTVFSFVAPSEITYFNSDLKPFFDYLTSNQGVPSSQFLVQLQAGTEPFNGAATLETSSYSAAIN